MNITELALALSEVGRCLAPVPLLAAAGLAGRVVAAAAGADAATWLRPIAEGSIATLAWVEKSGSWLLSDVQTEALRQGERFRLTGTKHLVLEGRDAERFFVIARLPGSRARQGLGLFALERDAPGVVVKPVSSLDVTRKLATLEIEGNELVAKHGTMEFTIHGRSKTGEISPRTHRREGPNFMGFVLRLSVGEGRYAGAAVVPQPLRGPYFPTYIDAIPTPDAKGYYWVSFSYGSRVDEELKKAIFAALPDRFDGLPEKKPEE